MIGKRTKNIWSLYIFLVVMDILLLKFSLIQIDIISIIKLHINILFQSFILFLCFYIYNKNIHNSIKIVEPIIFGFVMITPLTILTYISIQYNFPIVDSELNIVDKYFGFEWKEFISIIDSNYILANFLWLCYISFFYQLMVIPIILGFIGQSERSYQFVFCYAIIAIIASAISVFTPAYGTYTSYELDITTLKNIDTSFVFGFIKPFEAVRSNASFVLSADEFVGLLTFPSVHAGVAGLCAWVFWREKKIFFPFLMLNIGMATSAISHANHYFVDVLAGLAVAAVAVFLSSFLFNDRVSPSKEQAAPLLMRPV